MAAHLSSTRKRKVEGIMTHLSSAACEWLLIFLLFVDAVLWYMLQEFAKYCELQRPCPLCYHVLGKMKLGCSWSLMCSSHKEELSSLVLCSLHSKSFVQNMMLDKCIAFGSSDDESLFDVRPVGLGLGLRGCKANVEPPLLDVHGHRHFSHQDGIKKLQDKLRASMRHRRSKKNGVGYNELKLSSDSDSDGGDVNPSSIGDSHTRREHDVELGRRDRLGMPVNDVFSEKQTHQGSEMEDQLGLLDSDEPNPCLMKETISLDSIHSVPSASTTLRVTKKSIYIEESFTRVDRSAAMSIEAMAESSSDESTYSSNSCIRDLTGSSCQCAESTKLTEEDTKSMSQVSTFESGLMLKDAGLGPYDYEHEKSKKDESLDGVVVGEFVGGGIVDEQKQHGRSCIKALYEELEEERNAAGVAASQAMAMITRLQEEKAAVEMEAVQYIRMMELRAKHDMEALERANNLLSEKENELELYRNNSCADYYSLKKLVKNLYEDYCSENVSIAM